MIKGCELISFQIQPFDDITHAGRIQGTFTDFFGLDDGPGPRPPGGSATGLRTRKGLLNARHDHPFMNTRKA
jgi:hypothetical protein